jgi:MerR family transcriptional regulator, redox-sensitive transcriptional activator SoxR
MAELTIGQVAAEARLRASAIRYYEAEGLLPQPHRRSGRRVYHRSILDRLALIKLASQCGFSIAETRTLLLGFAPNMRPARRWGSLAKAKLDELSETMARISRMKRVLKAVCRCKCLSIQECGIRARRHARGSRGSTSTTC